MKKTLTVNLGGTVFQIDEDAYILLDNYLNNLRFHFRKEEGGEEIVRDMEMRISELFSEGMEGGQQVITIDNVEAVIERMGRPEQLDDETGSDQSDAFHDADNGQQHGSEGQRAGENRYGGAGNFYKESEPRPVKRLFRDVDNRVFGGVLSGIAAYFGWDPTALRIIYILLALIPSGVGIPLLIFYFVLQCIIPPARTATEKLQMRGEPVNVENIGKTVTDGFERDTKADETKKKRTGLMKFLDVLVGVIGVLLKIFLFFMLIFVCLPVFFSVFVALFALLMSALGIMIHIPGFCWDILPSIPWSDIVVAPMSGAFLLLSILLLVGIPVAVLIQAILQHFNICESMNSRTKIIFLVIWLIALVMAIVSFFCVSAF